ncbi:MAG: beta-ketoacyl-ACP synthase II [Rhabdochlamydiaceae bacterium]
MAHSKRIVVTGMGVVSCYGQDVDLFYDKLLAGQSGVGPISSFPVDIYPTRFAAEVKNFDPQNYLERKLANRTDPFIKYGVVASKKALEHAALGDMQRGDLDKTRCGIIVGSGMGGMHAYVDGVEALITKGFRRVSPFFVPYIITNMLGGLLAIDLGFMGPNYSISTACATSNYCIYSAAEHIRRGEADLMVCGGSEAALLPIGLSGFVACKALSERNEEPEKASRPWDKDRDGFVMGEGAGVLVLESLEHALKRGAPILAEYLGGSTSCDAHHMTDPRQDGSGVALCIQKAIADANIDKKDINYINAHATSTLAGDVAEMQALKSVFGSHIQNLSINATKSLVGHCLGAAGGIEAIATIKAILTSKVHPTINLENPEDCVEGINLVANKAQDCVVSAALSNSFGFGGHNSALIFAPFHS